MLTGNGKCLFTQSINDSGQAKERTFKTTTGSTASTSSLGFGTGKNLIRLISSAYLVVGAGTTEPTPNDYAMENLISSLSVVNSSNSGNRDNISYSNNYIYTCSRTFKNNTESPITVSEIGLQTTIVPYSGSSPGETLLAREVLENPVIIEPQRTFTFSITIG